MSARAITASSNSSSTTTGRSEPSVAPAIPTAPVLRSRAWGSNHLRHDHRVQRTQGRRTPATGSPTMTGQCGKSSPTRSGINRELRYEITCDTTAAHPALRPVVALAGLPAQAIEQSGNQLVGQHAGEFADQRTGLGIGGPPMLAGAVAGHLFAREEYPERARPGDYTRSLIIASQGRARQLRPSKKRSRSVTGQNRPSFHCWSLVDSLLDFVHRGVEYEDERSERFESTSAPHCERMGEIGLAFRTGGSNAKGFLFVAGRVTEHLRSLEA